MRKLHKLNKYPLDYLLNRCLFCTFIGRQQRARAVDTTESTEEGRVVFVGARGLGGIKICKMAASFCESVFVFGCACGWHL